MLMLGELSNHLWQSTVFAILAGLLTLAFRKNRAHVRYWLWFSASVKFVVPFALLLSLGSYLGRTQAAKSVPVPAITYAVVEAAMPFPVASSPTPSPRKSVHWIPLALISLWVCGALGMALLRWRAWRRIRAAVRASTPMDIPFPVPICSSRAVMEPGVVGLFQPILLLPASIEEHLAPNQMEAVLAHELCHVRRRDNLTAAVHMIVEAVFWFHPLVWWISARLMEERERACDEAVLESGSDPQVYAESILKTCEFCVASPLSCVSGVTGADLKKRMVRIMTALPTAKLGLGKEVVLLSTAVAILAAPIMLGLASSPQIQSQSSQITKQHLPSFEVASIKPNKSGDARFGIGFRPGRVSGHGLTARQLIAFAYGVKDFQVSGGPGWINSDRYDIEGKEPEPLAEELAKLSMDERSAKIRLMLQSLLADRFALKLTRTPKELPVYALIVAKGGPKVHAAALGDTYQNGMKGRDGRPVGHGGVMHMGRGEIQGQGVPLKQLAFVLSQQLGRTVNDQTGLKGNYDFTLQWTPDQNPAGMLQGPEGGTPGAESVSPTDSSGPSIFTAIQDQLGLKLESTKGPVEALVIDHIERPSEN